MTDSKNIRPSERDGWRLGTKEFLDSQEEFLKKYPEMDFYDGTITLGFWTSQGDGSNRDTSEYSTEDDPSTKFHSFFTNRIPSIEMDSDLSSVRKLKVSISASSTWDDRVLHHFYEEINKQR